MAAEGVDCEGIVLKPYHVAALKTAIDQAIPMYVESLRMREGTSWEPGDLEFSSSLISSSDGGVELLKLSFGPFLLDYEDKQGKRHSIRVDCMGTFYLGNRGYCLQKIEGEAKVTTPHPLVLKRSTFSYTARTNIVFIGRNPRLVATQSFWEGFCQRWFSWVPSFTTLGSKEPERQTSWFAENTVPLEK